MPQHRGYIIADREQTPVAEAFRSLRGKIQAAQSASGLRTLLFASASSGESGVMTAANTAASLAYAGKKVILVDYNFRTPSLHDIFGLTNTGITNIIYEGAKLDTLLQAPGIANMRVLPSGPTTDSPSNVLFHPALREISEQLSAQADLVIFVCSPLVVAANEIVTDACVLASKVDGVILLVEARTLRVHTASKVISLLKGARANLIGTVLNNVTDEQDIIF
jgi:capsular exopolysaccharide synthesis family protein